MGFVIEILLEGLVLLILARVMKTVHIKSYGTAIGVAIVVALLNATIGVLLRFPLNLVTLFLLSFIVRLIVTAAMIKLADVFFSGFRIESFKSALIMAVVLALTGALFSYIF
jgi:putative membrane protein